MKKILLALSVFIFLLSSCSKDGATGPQGPQGAQGPQGPQGAQGATGGINLTVINATYQPSDFTDYGTYGQAQYRSSVSISIPAITQDVYDNGMVLIYYQGSGSSMPWYSLPQTLYESTYSYTMTYSHYIGGADVQLYPSDLMTATPPFALTLKIIVVPPFSGKTTVNVNWKDYNAVKAYFHLKD